MHELHPWMMQNRAKFRAPHSIEHWKMSRAKSPETFAIRSRIPQHFVCPLGNADQNNEKKSAVLKVTHFDV